MERALRAAFFARQVTYLFGFTEVSESRAVLAAALAYAVAKALQGKARPLVALLATTVKFRLGLGRVDADKVDLAEHVWRLLVFRRVDLKLPPLGSTYHTLVSAVKDGVWARHRTEHRLFKAQSAKAFAAYVPMQTLDKTKPATLFVFTRDPKDVEVVLSDKESFPTRGKTGFTDLVGEGLLGLPSGPQHTAHRRLVMGFLTEKHLIEYSKVFGEETKVMLGKWGCLDDGGHGGQAAAWHTANVYADLSACSLDIIMRTAFGVQPGSREFLTQHLAHEDNELAKALDVALKMVILETIVPFVRYLPTPNVMYANKMVRKMKDDMKRLFDAKKREFEEQQQQRGGARDGGVAGPDCMLTEMLRMRNAGMGEKLSDQEILDEIMTVRGAGHETTSNTLCWAMLLLAQNPHKLEKLREEADRVVSGDVATYDEARAARYCHSVVLEALRLFPTVPSFPRECHKDVVLPGEGKYDIPAGSYVFVSQRALNRMGWDRPDEFVPERFASVEEVQMGKPVGNPATGEKFAFQPFGAANRSCVGQRIAMLEAVQILVTLGRWVEWEIAPEQVLPVPEVAEVTLGSKSHGLHFRVRRRVAPRALVRG